MIIWSRWGILVLMAGGLGALSGFGLQAIFAPRAIGPGAAVFGAVGLLLAGGFTWLLAQRVMPRLDRPRPLTVTQRLAQPIVNERGVRQTHQVVAVTHPQTGEQLYSRPQSTLFFIPVAIWPFIYGAIGAVLLVVAIVKLLLS